MLKSQTKSVSECRLSEYHKLENYYLGTLWDPQAI